ncbi:MAG: type II secretion system protein [Candidatus Sericytochromatia bacterium]
MKYVTQKGFTLVEMMVVTTILGLLIAIGIINLQSANIRAKEASVRSNMHSFQAVVEIYATDYNGFYPPNVSSLINDPETSKQRLLFEMNNPFSSLKGITNSYDEESVTPKQPGLITYEVKSDLASYSIYGYDNRVQRLKQNGQELILSNK